MLKNKSILLPNVSEDGIRVCVMRSIHDEYEFDLWYQALAPSRKLVEDYVINKMISWKKFQKAYLDEQKNRKQYLLHLISLIEKAHENNLDVTLLCGEEDFHGCHREIIMRELIKIKPEIKKLMVDKL